MNVSRCTFLCLFLRAVRQATLTENDFEVYTNTLLATWVILVWPWIETYLTRECLQSECAKVRAICWGSIVDEFVSRAIECTIKTREQGAPFLAVLGLTSMLTAAPPRRRRIVVLRFAWKQRQLTMPITSSLATLNVVAQRYRQYFLDSNNPRMFTLFDIPCVSAATQRLEPVYSLLRGQITQLSFAYVVRSSRDESKIPAGITLLVRYS